MTFVLLYVVHLQGRVNDWGIHGSNHLIGSSLAWSMIALI